MLIGLLTILTILAVLLSMPFALAYLTTLENKPKDHWFHLRSRLAHRYGRSKTAFYIFPAPFTFTILPHFLSNNDLDVVSQVLIILAAIVWFFVASWGFLFSGKHVLENPIIIAAILFSLLIASWIFPDDGWFFLMYGYPITFLWGTNIFKYRAIRYANTIGL